MPSFKYGARTYTIPTDAVNASTAGSYALGGWQYIPRVGGAGGAVDGASEKIIGATLILANSIASAASTAAAGSVLIAASQYNSAGSSLNSANLFVQSSASQAALTQIDLSSTINWTLTPGDFIVVWANANTTGVPLLPGMIFSINVDAVTAA